MTHYFTADRVKQERGNVLFLILLAVVLLAALAYAVTNSLRGGGKDASSESAQSIAAQMMQYATLIENTITRAMLINNVPDYGFDMSGSNTASSASNATCVTPECRLFDKSSTNGLMASIRLTKGLATGIASSPTRFYVTNVVNVGTPAEDVVLIFGDLSKPVCDAVNAIVGISPNLANMEGFGGSPTNYSDTYTSFPVSGSNIGDEDPAFIGKSTGCFRHSSNGYSFYHVVMTR